MKDSKSSTLRHRLPYDALRDPALWAWLIVALLAMIPARGALHLILAA